MNVLERVERSLTPGGVLLDMHPVPPAARIEAGGRDLGPLEEREFFEIVRATERGVEQTVERGLFRPDGELGFETLERVGTADDLVEKIAGWEGASLPAAVERAARASSPPFDIREHVVLRRFRAR